MVVLGTIRSFLEQFCGHLLPKIDKVSDFEIPPRRALRGGGAAWQKGQAETGSGSTVKRFECRVSCFGFRFSVFKFRVSNRGVPKP